MLKKDMEANMKTMEDENETSYERLQSSIAGAIQGYRQIYSGNGSRNCWNLGWAYYGFTVFQISTAEIPRHSRISGIGI